MCVLTLELQALQPRTDSPRPQFPHLFLALQPRKGRAPCLSFPIYSQLCTSGQAEPQASVSHLFSFAIYCCDKHRDQNHRRGEKERVSFILPLMVHHPGETGQELTAGMEAKQMPWGSTAYRLVSRGFPAFLKCLGPSAPGQHCPQASWALPHE